MQPRNFHELLARNLPGRAAHPALELGEELLCYAELAERVDRVAAWLEARGIQPGDRVVVHLHKSVAEVVALFAIARVGAVFVDVHYRWTVEQLRFVLDDSEARALFTDRRKARALEEAGGADSLDALLLSDRRPEGMQADLLDELPPASPSRPGPAPEELGALIYTSGSTGKPKGVMLSQHNLVEGAECVAEYLANVPEDRLLALLPFNFDAGLHQLTTAFLVGATVVLQPVPLPAEVVRSAREKRVTGIGAVPPAWVAIARHLAESGEELEGLRYISNTGGKIPSSVLEQLPALFPGADIFLMYGLTEAFRSTYLPPELFASKRGAIGRAIPRVAVHVVDGERICADEEVGELVHSGALISQGYWKRPEETAARIRPCPALSELIGDEPVCYSGDLVRRDADGILWFVGRRDGMIKCSGFRLSPTEVEELAHASGLVAEAVAFGEPNEELGQEVHLVVSAPGGEAAGLDLEELRGYLASNAPSYMVPARIHLAPGAMPQTASGKIDRPAVIAAARQDPKP